MAGKRFPAEFDDRGAVKLTDKLFITNIDTGVDEFTTVASVAAILMPVKKDTAISGGVWTFEVPKEYMLHEIFASHNVSSLATYTLDVGTTLGGSEIISSAMASVPLAGAQTPKPFGVHRHFSYAATTTIYVTITGVGAIADIRAQLIYNT